MNNNIHSENPSIFNAIENTKKGARVIFNKSNQDVRGEIYTNSEDEDVKVNSIDFYTKITIDKDQFIKLYISALPALSNLKNSTKLLFQYILIKINEEIGKDVIYLNYSDYSRSTYLSPLSGKFSQSTFSRALNELLDNEIIYKTPNQHLYFINIAYIFNGDRLKFITEYQLDKRINSKGNE